MQPFTISVFCDNQNRVSHYKLCGECFDGFQTILEECARVLYARLTGKGFVLIRVPLEFYSDKDFVRDQMFHRCLARFSVDPLGVDCVEILPEGHVSLLGTSMLNPVVEDVL